MASEIEVVVSGIGGIYPRCKNFEEFGSNILANEYLVNYSNRWNKETAGVEPWIGETDYKVFDHTFFGIHKQIALWTEPTYRAGFERAFEAIVDAGINPSILRGSPTRVYYASCASDYQALFMRQLHASEGYSIMGHNQAMACNRISYLFDFTGESVCIGSTSGSLYSGFRLIKEAIQSSVCDCALLVVSNATAHSHLSKELRNLGILSEDGITRPFDENGTGSVRSDCTVAFCLQRADQAKRCYAKVVAGTSMYVHPRLKFDVTLPSPAGFESFLNSVYKEGHVEPGDVTYVEADGSGWPLQDRAELTAMANVFGAKRPGRQPLLVSSAKSNVANTENVSGAVGVCRAVVAMESGTIPATINCKNPMKGAEGVQVVTKNHPWRLDSGTAVGVSSIGYAGEMGHVILRPNLKEKKKCDLSKELPRLVTISSRTEDTARLVAEKVKSYPFDPEYLRLVQEVFSPGIRGYEFRTFVICPPLPDEAVVVSKMERRTVWYVFSGMGSQWAGMGTGLMELPIFRDTIERLQAILETKGMNLKQIISETGPEAFDNILKSFVGITACQIALTNVLTAMGLKPDGILGHSVGEVACAYADGCLTEEQTILAAWARGVASNEATLIKGMMAAIGMGYKDIIKRLPPNIDVACRNSSTSSTISGPVEDVEEFVKTLTEEGIFARSVNVSDIAYHSRYIQPAGPHLRKHLEAVIPHPRKRSAKWVSTSVPLELQDRPAAQYCSAEYQTNNLLSPVLFEDGIKHIPQQAVVVEIAPHGLMQAILKRELGSNVHVSLCQRGSPDAVRTLLSAVGKMSVAGMNPTVSALYPPVSFPVSRGTPPLSSLVYWYHENSVSYADYDMVTRSFITRNVSIDSPSITLKGVRLYALSEILEMVWECQAAMTFKSISGAKVIFEDVHVVNYESIPSDDNDLTITANVNIGTGRFEVYLENSQRSQGDKEDVSLLVWGSIQVTDEDDDRKELPHGSMKDMNILDGEEIFSDMVARGLSYGEKYRSLASIAVGEQDWLIRIRKGKSVASIMEATFQTAILRVMECAQEPSLTRTIQRLELDPRRLLDTDFDVHFHLPSGTMRAPGFYMAGLTTFEPYLRQTVDSLKSSMSFQFVPYGDTNLQSVGEFLSLAVQMAMENIVETQGARGVNISILELQNCAGSNGLGSAVRSLLQERMGVQAEVRTLTVRSGQTPSVPDSDRPWLIVSGPSTLAEGARLVARTGGLLLTRCPERTALSALRVLAEQRMESNWITLLCQPTPLVGGTRVIHLGGNDPLPMRIHTPSVLVWRGQPVGGVASAVEEVKKRPYGQSCRLVFILDEEAPPFSVSDPMYFQQLALHQLVNVLRQGLWGSWRALPLPGTTSAALSANRLGDLKINVLGLNPRNRQTMAGKSIWSGHVDYVGSAGTSGRVMGVAQWSSDRMRPRIDPMLRWQVPDSWSDKEAATVPYVYATVYHALHTMAELKKGESILIHEGASAIGQAAIRVALQLKCSPIFTTAATEDQRAMIRKLFPQLEERCILSCADTSFEWQTRVQTRGHGVRVVMSGLPGLMLKASLKCIAPWGRFLHYGREDMVAASSFGTHFFLKSIAMFGVAGERLFQATPRDRQAVLKAVKEGIDTGVVQPIAGAKAFSAARLCSPEDAGWIRDDCDFSKAVLEVTGNVINGPQECSPQKSYVIVGGDHHESLQVAGWLSVHGARKVLVVPSGRFSAALVRHRQRTCRMQFGTNVRVEEVRSWDKAAAEKVVQTAAATAPIDAVIVLVKDDPTSARTPALLHAALLAHPEAALLMLTDRAQTACALSPLCEARRSAGQRAACLSGRLDAAADHLADMLSGARPAVTLLAGHLSVSPSGGFEPRLLRLIPSSSDGLAALGVAFASLPQKGIRFRELRRAATAGENFPVFVFPPLGVLDSTTEPALLALASRIIPPLVCVEYRPLADIHQLAKVIAQELTRMHPAGPFNILGLSISNPLALEVSRCLEDIGHNAVTFLVDGDVMAVKDWATSVTDQQLLSMAFSEDDRVMEVLEEASAGDGWSLLMPQVLPQCRADPLHVDTALQALRVAVRSIAAHQPRLMQPVRCHLVAIKTSVSDPCCFNMMDDKVEPTVMPRAEVKHGLESSWLALKLNDNCAWSKLANQTEVQKLIL